MRSDLKWGIGTVVVLVGFAALSMLPTPRPRFEPVQDGKGLGAWVEDLKNTSAPEKQGRAARALASMGPAAQPAVPALIAALDESRGTSAVRSEAAEALRAIGGPAVPALVETIQNPGQRWTVRVGAARIVGRLGPAAEDAVPALLDFLKTKGARRDPASATEEGWVLWEVAAALVKIGKNLDETMPAVLEAVQAVNEPRTQALFDEIVRFGAAARPGLQTARAGPDPLTRVEAAALLHRIGVDQKQAMALLTRALNDPKESVRERAAQRLGDLGPQAATAVPALTKTLHGAPPPLQNAVARALERIGSPAVAALTSLLGDNDVGMRRLAASCLVEIPPQGLAALRKSLESEDPAVRELALEALVRKGDALDGQLGEWLKDPNPRQREITAVIISRLPAAGAGSEETSAARIVLLLPLLDLLDDPAPGVRRVGAAALGNLGKAGLDAAPNLIVALKDDDPTVRIEAALTLWRLDGRKEPNMPVLLESLKAPQPDTRARAAAALGVMQGQARTAVPALRHLLEDEDEGVRRAAAAALQAIGTH